VAVNGLTLAADHDRVCGTELVLDGDLVHAGTVGKARVGAGLGSCEERAKRRGTQRRELDAGIM
jgi:hypothetical protein